ncbi:DUF1499 domain-containing protein [uncultured Algimonas sp.]|uniref:DUF1499 domain-containing protein n=1 Tax=uncultured Algimonas sp. TaxID=1547920 RepID=UPI002636191C|nr:DUF1499 domain-containing protein [uncultured Algimonas sp.]
MTDSDPTEPLPDHGPVVTETARPVDHGHVPRRVRLRRWILWAALALAILSPLWFMLAGLGAKWGLWSWRTGLGTMTREIGPMLLAATLAAGLIALAAWFFIKPRKGLLIGLLAVAVPVLAFAYQRGVQAKAAELPFIHDITTDTQDPPVFGAAIMAEREATPGVNTVDYAGKRARGEGSELVSALQTQAYPKIRTLVLSKPPQTVFGRAEQVARDLGWAIKEADPAAGRIDATDTTFWYGFKDDVAIRLRPAPGGGTRLDVRSVSRVGGSDLGANAERIGAFLDRMAE